MTDPNKTNETTKSAISMMPMWITDSQIDPSWVQEKLSDLDHVPVCCAVKDISNDTRKGDVPKNGATLLLQLSSRKQDGNHDDHTDFSTKTPKTTSTLTVVVKQVPTTPARLAMSRQLGLAREAIFYNQLAPKIRKMSSSSKNTNSDEASILPTIHYAYGDMSGGSKVIIMEDLSKGFVDSGILFGPGNPNNWNRDLKRRIDDAYPPHSGSKTTVPTSFEVANQTFLAIANVHATFWRDEALLLNNTEEEYVGSSWLRGSAWICGKDEESWRASQGMIQRIWEKYTNDDGGESENSIRWDPLVRQILQKAMKGISWESQKERLNTNSNFCLVHGDFWPGNVMISTDHHATSTSTKGNGAVRDLRLLDWEMVGIGSGPQDLGQYILSNMDPAERRKCEEQLVRNYHHKLVNELGVSNFSWEECWSEYKIGGLERWLWFLVYFCSLDGPVMRGWAQYFHDQIEEFVHDHGILPEDVTQPRP